MVLTHDPVEWVRLGVTVSNDCKEIGQFAHSGLKYYVTRSGYEILRKNFFDYLESDMVFARSPEIWLSVQFGVSSLVEVDAIVNNSGRVEYLKRSPALDPPPPTTVITKEVEKIVEKVVEKEVPAPIPRLEDIVFEVRPLFPEYLNPSASTFDELWPILHNPESKEQRDEFVRRFFTTPSFNNEVQTALYAAFIERLMLYCNYNSSTFTDYMTKVLEG